MFWKKKIVKPTLLKAYVEKSINGNEILAFLKSSSAIEFVKWLENLEYTLKAGIFEKPAFTNEDLQFRKGEVNALKILRLKINEIRNAKPEPEETEENDNA